MAFDFLKGIPARIGNFLGSNMGDVGGFADIIRQTLRPSQSSFVSPIPRQGQRPLSPIPESDILGNLRESLTKGEKGEKGKGQGEKRQMGNLAITYPTPEGGKVTIKVDVPTQQSPQFFPGVEATPGLAPRGFPETPSAYQDFISSASGGEVDPLLLSTLASTESGFDPSALGVPVGGEQARGMFQFLPSTVDWLVKTGITEPFDPLDPAQSAKAAADYLRWLIEQRGGLEGALTQYRGGEQSGQQVLDLMNLVKGR